MQKPGTTWWPKFAAVALSSLMSFLMLLFYHLDMTSEIHSYGQQYEVLEKKVDHETEEKLREALKRAAKDKKIVLIWHPDGDSVRAETEVAKSVNLSPVENCGLCEFTADKSKIEDTHTAAVIFLYRYVTHDVMPSPKQRRSDQLYIWWTKESPTNLMNKWNYDFGYADSRQFNLTMTNRRDADIYSPYGRAVDMLPVLEKNFTRILESKSRLAAAAVSNCDSPHARLRLRYLNRLIASGFQLDAVGRCFGSRAISKTNADAFGSFLKAYKFYFAFENSYHCRDYVTEKVFKNAFGADAVPVVWGPSKADCEALLPPNSYIYVEDFSSLEELASYLNYLDKNDTAYQEYFRWRSKKPENLPESERKTDYCQICRIVHGINIDDVYHADYNASAHLRPLLDTSMSAPRFAKNLRSWMYETENEECLQPTAHAAL